MDNDKRLCLIRARQKRYGYIDICPYCKKEWWHEDQDYIYNFDIFKKLQCPYCKKIYNVGRI